MFDASWDRGARISLMSVDDARPYRVAVKESDILLIRKMATTLTAFSRQMIRNNIMMLMQHEFAARHFLRASCTRRSPPAFQPPLNYQRRP